MRKSWDHGRFPHTGRRDNIPVGEQTDTMELIDLTPSQRRNRRTGYVYRRHYIDRRCACRQQWQDHLRNCAAR